MASKKKAVNKINKEDFIDKISKMTPQQINEFIVKNGKPPKLIDPIIWFDPETGMRINNNLGGT